MISRLCAPPLILLTYIFEAGCITLVTSVSKRSSLSQSKFGKSYQIVRRTIHWETIYICITTIATILDFQIQTISKFFARDYCCVRITSHMCAFIQVLLKVVLDCLETLRLLETVYCINLRPPSIQSKAGDALQMAFICYRNLYNTCINTFEGK